MSLIAMTLNSNLYLTGLHEIDYMEMKEKVNTENELGKSKFLPGNLMSQSTK